jgi:hypothetical protein
MLETTLDRETRTGFLKDICAYFRDFLDTDFKRQSAPKRGINLKDPAGNLTGIDAAKYPDLVTEVWRLLRRPAGDGPAFSLTVPRGRYRGQLRRALREVIERYTGALEAETLKAVADRGAASARELKASLQNDPDGYADTVTNSVKADLVRTVAVPLVKRLEAALERARGDAYEAIYNIEDELGERLIEAAREPIGSALATALVDNSFDELDQFLLDLVDTENVAQKLQSYFDSFTTTDFFQELHELTSTLKLRENFETYLYIGELRFNRVAYPLFYLTLSIELEDTGSSASPPTRIFTSTKKPSISRPRRSRGRRESRTASALTNGSSISMRTRILPASYRGSSTDGRRHWRWRRSILVNRTRKGRNVASSASLMVCISPPSTSRMRRCSMTTKS